LLKVGPDSTQHVSIKEIPMFKLSSVVVTLSFWCVSLAESKVVIPKNIQSFCKKSDEAKWKKFSELMESPSPIGKLQKVEFNSESQKFNLQAHPVAENQFEDFLSRAKIESSNIAYYWYDTILEGPYSKAGESLFTPKFLFLSGEHILGITGTVSMPVLQTESEGCTFSEKSQKWSKKCEPATIAELFTFDACGNVIDEGDYAEVQ
jgi:hypothetical protein